MATEYKLSHTAAEIDEKLGKVDETVLYTEQSLTEAQKAQARDNIGAVGAALVEHGHAWDSIEGKPFCEVFDLEGEMTITEYETVEYPSNYTHYYYEYFEYDASKHAPNFFLVSCRGYTDVLVRSGVETNLNGYIFTINANGSDHLRYVVVVNTNENYRETFTIRGFKYVTLLDSQYIDSITTSLLPMDDIISAVTSSMTNVSEVGA